MLSTPIEVAPATLAMAEDPARHRYLLLVLGAAPFGYLSWFGLAHTLEPLSFPPLTPARRVHVPSFKTDLDEGYQIDIYFVPYHRTPLQLDWKIVDDTAPDAASARRSS